MARACCRDALDAAFGRRGGSSCCVLCADRVAARVCFRARVCQSATLFAQSRELSFQQKASEEQIELLKLQVVSYGRGAAIAGVAGGRPPVCRARASDRAIRFAIDDGVVGRRPVVFFSRATFGCAIADGGRPAAAPPPPRPSSSSGSRCRIGSWTSRSCRRSARCSSSAPRCERGSSDGSVSCVVCRVRRLASLHNEES